MEKSHLSLREIQLAELELLNRLDDFCRKHAIQYSLIGGTLLGAVRHKGFIPWDDDVDVCMPRPDYNKFLALNIEQHFPPYVKRIRGTDPESAYAFSKLVDTRIHVESIYSEEAEQGLWIDIFPVDGLPDAPEKIRWLYRKVEILQRLQGLCNARVGCGKTMFRRRVKWLLKPIVRLGKDQYRLQIEKAAQQYPFVGAKNVGVVNGSLHGVKERMNGEQFMKTEWVEFEHRIFPAFACFHEYLSGIYGDYMVLPPEEDRKQHIRVAWIGEEKND